jgi:hypothetical protein
VGHVSVALGGHQETSDRYPTIVPINRKWRVIGCAAGIQWILQTRRGERWDSRYFCRTRAGLMQCVREHVGEIDPVELLRLPERFPDRGAA